MSGQLASLLGEGLLDSTYTPSRNPDIYGVDPKTGSFVDKTGQPIPLTTPFYNQPNWLQKVISPTARQYAGMNVQMANSGLLSQKTAADQRNAERATTGEDVSTMPTSMLPYGTNTPADVTAALHPWAMPSKLTPEVQANAYANTGAPGILGNLGGQADINIAHKNLQESNAGLLRTPTVQAGLDQQAVNSLAQLVHVDPLQIQLAEKQLNGELGRNATEQEILDRVAQTKLTGAKAEQTAAPANAAATVANANTGASVALQNQADAGLIAGRQHNENVFGNINSQTQPDVLSSTPYLSRIIGDSVMPSNGQLNPMYKSPGMTGMQAMQRGLGGPATGTLKSGTSYVVDQSQPRVLSPTIGQVYNGAQASDPNRPLPPPQPSPEDVQDKQEAINDTGHKALIAQHDAKIAQLKAEKSQLEHQRVATGPLANYIHATIVDPAKDVYNLGKTAVDYQKIQAQDLLGKLQSLWTGN